MNELDKLRDMLTAAEIPFESIQEEFDEEYIKRSPCPEFYAGNRRYHQNQIIYGRYNDKDFNGWVVPWKFDGICHYGSYGVEQGLIETYGSLGTDSKGEPRVMTAEQAFEIIKNDYSECE